MAKKKKAKGISRSQSIRNYLAKHRSATPKEIVAGLAENGIEVSIGLVSNIKYSKRQTGKKKVIKKRVAIKKKAGAKKAAARKRTTVSFTATDLFEAKKLSDYLGGIEKARKALDTLENLR